MKIGSRPIDPNARTGELTPPGIRPRARANSAAERSSISVHAAQSRSAAPRSSADGIDPRSRSTASFAVTHTDPSATVTPVGWPGTRTRRPERRPVSGSSRVTVSSPPFVTQTKPSP